MKKVFQLYLVNVLLALSFLIVGFTGIVKMPGWFNTNPDKYLFMMKIHDWSGIVMVALVLVHLIQHWKWIVSMTKHIFSKPKVKKVSIVVLVVILTAIVALVLNTKLEVMNNSQDNSDFGINDDLNDTSKELSENVLIQTGGCPHGIHDDPAPGLCGLYIDKDNNGECDHGQT